MISKSTKILPQSGRSFVEMLGTLAIMGILSIGAIMGFNYAMNKHRSNEILDEARKRAYTVMTQIQLGLKQSLSEYDRHNVFAGGSFGSNIVTEGLKGQFALKITDVKKAVCQNLVDSVGVSTPLRRISVLSKPSAEIDSCADEGEYLLVYNNNLVAGNAKLCQTDSDCGACGTCNKNGGICHYPERDSRCPGETPYCNAGTCQGCEVGKFKANDNRCYDCSNTTHRRTSISECHACSNKFITQSGYCYDCEDKTSVALSVSSNEECTRCPHRIVAGRYCDHCDKKNGLETANVEICSQCPNRYVTYRGCFLCEGEVAADHKSCIFHCPEGQFGTSNGCQPCNSTAQQIFMQPANDTEGKKDCESCSNRSYVTDGQPRVSDGRYCALKCTNPDEFLDANGNCRTCDSASFRIGWRYNESTKRTTQALYDKCLLCPDMVPDTNNNMSCYNYTQDVSTTTIPVSTTNCIRYWKGRRYVSANNKCTLCPDKINDPEAWEALDETQKTQCTPE